VIAAFRLASLVLILPALLPLCAQRMEGEVPVAALAMRRVRLAATPTERRATAKAGPEGVIKRFILILPIILSACASAMSQREAVQLASISIRKYCGAQPGCASLRLGRAQKIKDRWLVQFETSTNAYGVAVDAGGNTDISVWDKTAPR
jgi:hypothetical protein